MPYKTMPPSSVWRTDSSVTFAVRKSDAVLDRIDGLLEHYWTSNDNCQRLIFLCDLFFSLDYWLKTFKTNSRMEKGREPAVRALYACAAESLCVSFECTVNGLPRELEFMWGRELTAGGVNQDHVLKVAQYITRAEAAKYRLWFKGGAAYQLPWWNPGLAQKPQRAESKHAYTLEAQVMNAPPAVNYGFFVLTMSRDLYMAKHNPTDGKGIPGFYHSSYVAGDPVQCSGTMLIERGVIKRIRFNSGHYQPTLNNMRSLVMALRMWGVRLNDVVFEDYQGQLVGGTGKVQDLVASTNVMSTLNQGREAAIKNGEQAFLKKPGVDSSKIPAFDPRLNWGNRPRMPEAQPAAIKHF